METPFLILNHLSAGYRNRAILNCTSFLKGGQSMPIGTILLIILILALVGVIPVWPHKPVLGVCTRRRGRAGSDYPFDPALIGQNLINSKIKQEKSHET
jgi:hypothetical protein